MGKTKASDDPDRDIDIQESSPPYKKPRKRPPEPWPLPEFEPLHIEPQNEHVVVNLPPHINPGRAWQLFHLFLTDEVLEDLVLHTNEYADLHRPERGRPWIPTTPREMLAYIATYIYMGLHPEPAVAQYWNTKEKEPLHPQVSKHMSAIRWQQIDRFFHISKPKSTLAEDLQYQRESPFQKVDLLSEQFRQVSKLYWQPSTNLSVDEAMARFEGRSKEKVKIPLKPIPEGFKIWCLANLGYLLDWCFHAREEGPVDLDEYWTTTGPETFNKTQAVVLDLVSQLPNQGKNHAVWTDNLFTSVRLLTQLREMGVGAAGTVRTGKSRAQLDDEEEAPPQETPQQPRRSSKRSKQPKEVNQGLDLLLSELKLIHAAHIPWGRLYARVLKNGKVLQFAWKDQAVVLFMTTITIVQNGQIKTVKRQRKRPAATATNARTSRAVFGKEVLKELEIPQFIDLYNHFMNGVDQADQADQADQLRVYYK